MSHLSPQDLDTIRRCCTDEAAFQTVMEIITRPAAPPALQTNNRASHPNDLPLRQVTDVLPVMIWTADERMHSGWGNLRWRSFTGLSEQQNVDDWLEKIHPDDRARCWEAVNAALQNPAEMGAIEYRLRADNGQYRWVLDTGVSLELDSERYAGFVGVCLDITDSRAREEALRQSELRLRGILDHSVDGVFLTDEQGQVVEWNRGMERISGQPRDQVIGQYVLDVQVRAGVPENHAPDKLTLARASLAQFFATGQAPWLDQPRDQRIVHADGSERIVQEIAFSVPTPSGYTLGGIMRDVTAHKQAEAALRRSEAYFRMLVETAREGIWVLDAQARTLYTNPELARMLGYSPSEMIGRYPHEFMDPEVAAQAAQELELRLRGEEHQCDYRFRRPDGSTLWALISARLMFDADGLYEGVFAMLTDITERKRTEEALRESELISRQIMDNARHVFFMRDPLLQKTLYISPAYESIWGRPRAEMMTDPMNAFKYVHSDDVDGLVLATQRELLYGEMVSHEFRIVRPDGAVRWIWLRDFPVYDDSGTVYRIAGIAEDITHFKLAQQHAEQLALERERARILADFIKDASHEFRTPLSVINTSLYLLDRDDSEERRGKRIRAIQEQVDNILRLVEALVLLSRLDGDFYALTDLVDINDTVRSAGASIGSALVASGLTLKLLLQEPLHHISGSAEGLYQALVHVLDNALRYTPTGGTITVTTYAQGSEIVIEVHDTGIGIREGNLGRIFELFFREDQARSTRGFGLGLPIARKIAEGHGGRIEVESCIGLGSTFRLIVPR